MRVGGPNNVGRAVQTVPTKDKRNVGSCWLVRLACIEGKNYIVIEKRLVSGIRFKSD